MALLVYHIDFYGPLITLMEAKDFGSKTSKSWSPWYGVAFHLTAVERNFCTPLSITFAFVATHNHFVLDRGGKVFKQSAPVIKLPAEATEQDHLALLGVLNSSTACFWMKQVFHNKGSTVESVVGSQTRCMGKLLRTHRHRPEKISTPRTSPNRYRHTPRSTGH